MQPKQRRKNKRIVALVAAAAISTLALSVGNTQSRRIEWASAELVYTPQSAAVYESDCLTALGQNILLSDWTAEETGKTLVIRISRPPQPEEESPEEEPAVPQETEENTEENTEQPEDPVPVWPQDELTVTPDEAAQQHIVYESLVEENQLVITLARLPESPGLAETKELTLTVQWQGLTGTICVDMLPYGALAQPGEETEEPTEPDHQIDTTLTAVKISDTIHADRPAVCVMLNLQTGSDFHVFLTANGAPLKRVRWSMDGGQTYSLLYDTAQLDFTYPYPAGWDGVVLLDMSQALDTDVRPTIGVEATGYSRYECIPAIQALPTPTAPVFQTADLPKVMKIATRWGAAVMNIESIQRLTVDEEGNLTYLEDNTFQATVTASGVRMESTQTDRLPASGSYRFQVKWIWNGICIEEQTIYFFVNTN